ncbi:hypothetical protein BT67DRAFT_457703 [Trichocladium antarcticum]|uniref:RING-type domain-containing protein n=1 Tax=Trichocladium antarcticum TaxID=1450529 RepID=A0AAN6UF38_9PEZI|nr:hypothetical protein BT67DRAFT_457703 [Trichocladium antarcticum]
MVRPQWKTNLHGGLITSGRAETGPASSHDTANSTRFGSTSTSTSSYSPLPNMGNEVSQPARAAPQESTAPLPEPTPAKPRMGQMDPLTPMMTPPRTYNPLTPPPSGHSKQLPDAEPAAPYSGPPTPLSPASPACPATPVLSPSVPFTDSQLQPPPAHPCSRCHSPLPDHQPSPPRPLQCGHLLCGPCLRASLLCALATDPFTPATCCAAPAITNPSLSPSPSPPPSPSPSPSPSPPAAQPQPQPQPQPAPIPLATLGTAATPAEFLAYRLKLREQHTPRAGRLYCRNDAAAGCGMFLAHADWLRGRSATCPLCAARTCRVCGGAAHFGSVLGGMGGMGWVGKRRRRKGFRTAGKRGAGGGAGRRGPLCRRAGG